MQKIDKINVLSAGVRNWSTQQHDQVLRIE